LAGDPLDLLPALKRLLTEMGITADPVTLASDTGTTAILRLALAGGQFDAVVPSSYSGAGLLVADLTDTPGSALLTGNRIRNRFPDGQTAVVLGLADVAVTGNVIANEVPIREDRRITDYLSNAAADVTSRSLVLHEASHPRGAPPVAIVGNVFVDPPMLPHRPPPLPHWQHLNTMVYFTEV
jgi:hypothetical protein